MLGGARCGVPKVVHPASRQILSSIREQSRVHDRTTGQTDVFSQGESMADASSSEAALSNDVAPVRAAYEELLPEILAVPEDEVLQINIDIPSAVTSILGAL